MSVISKRGFLLAAAGAALLLLAGGVAWSLSPAMPRVAWRALNTADSYELFSLEPWDLEKPLHDPVFYGNPILGSVQIRDPVLRAKLNHAMDHGADEQGDPAACFNPRHGIRVRHGGVTTDFVICFECRQVHVYRDGKGIAYYFTSDSPQAVFDEVLTKANVPLAAKKRS